MVRTIGMGGSVRDYANFMGAVIRPATSFREAAGGYIELGRNEAPDAEVAIVGGGCDGTTRVVR